MSKHQKPAPRKDNIFLFNCKWEFKLRVFCDGEGMNKLKHICGFPKSYFPLPDNPLQDNIMHLGNNFQLKTAQNLISIIKTLSATNLINNNNVPQKQIKSICCHILVDKNDKGSKIQLAKRQETFYFRGISYRGNNLM